MRLQRLIISLLLSSLSLVVVAEPAPVKVAQIKRGPIEHRVSSYGILSPNIEELSFQIPGRIEKFLVDEGNRVKKGQLLAQLETKDAKDTVATAQVALDQALRRLERMQTLHRDGSIGKSVLEDAQGEYEQVRIAFEQAKLNLERCAMLAPDDGVILQEIIDSRTSVTPGQAIYSFQSDNEAWKVKVGLIDRHAFTFKKGSRAEVRFAPFATETFGGNLTRLAGIADKANGLFTAEVAVRTQGHQLRPGMLATVDLYESSGREFASIPLDALIRLRDRRAVVYVLSPNSSVVKELPVTVETIQNDIVFLAEPLEEFTRVVVRGQLDLQDATLIQVVN